MSSADLIADDALRLIEAGDPAAAASLLQPLVAAHPDIERYQYRLGVALSALGERVAALAHLRHAVCLYPSFGLFHQTYVNELAKSGDPGDLLRAYADLGGFTAQTREVQVFAVTALSGSGAPAETLFTFDRAVLSQGVVRVRVSETPLPRGVVRLCRNAAGLELEVCRAFAQTPLMVERLMAFHQYFAWLAEAEEGAATADVALMCVDDLPPPGNDPVMCFSGFQANHILIPDSAFLGSDGYAHLHAMAQSAALPWTDRAAAAYWRGSLTGLAGTMDETLALPRVQICALTQPDIDAKITGLHQFAHLEPALSQRLAARGFLTDREPESRNFDFRYLIDVDGNSNSWPGLYLKLLSAGTVLKLTSAWRQWYYDRLAPGQNLLVANQVEELPSLVAWCLAHDDSAEAIGKAGHALAMSLVPKSEFAAFLAGWRKAARQD